MRKKILFISHEASITGATIVLLHFLRWFKANTDIPFEIILKKGGVLFNDFRSLAPVTSFHSKKNTITDMVLSLFRQYGFHLPVINLKKNIIRKKFRNENIGLIYSNTITNREIMDLLIDLNSPFLCHVHELEWGIQFYGKDNFNRVKHLTNRFIAVSEAVKNNLINNYNIPSELIDISYEFIPTNNFDSIEQKKCRKYVSDSLGIPMNAYIICASGTTGWRKGPDLFIQVANIIHKLQPDIPTYFLWIGGETQGQRFYDLKHDIEKSDLTKYVHFIGEQKDPSIYFASCDIFLMVSREDPFPLVCLEAAALGKPIICFDKAGGMKEFVEDDSGIVVPYLDILGMAKASLHLLQSPDLREKLGQKAKIKVIERHDINVAAPKLLQIITKYMHQ
jgi:glycosyltransferase involved in cell wall biosynthesis